MTFRKKIIKKMTSSTFISTITKYIIYGFLRALFTSYRFRIIFDKKMAFPLHKNPGIFYFWHQSIIPSMAFFFKTKSKGHCIVSPSKDGKIAGFICEKLGFNVIYGSSYKSPISLVKSSLKVLTKDQCLCIVGDGSRGPAFQLQPGIKSLALKADVPLIFVESTPQWAYTFKKSWDQFKIPLPFSRIDIRIHTPVNLSLEPKQVKQSQQSAHARTSIPTQ